MTDAAPPDGGVDGAGATRVTPTELGARLAALRSVAGLTVDDVAARTRIRGGLIRSMESGNFAPCGGAVYARGHLRSIAHVVGAPGDDLVEAYDDMAGAPPAAAREPMAQDAAAADAPAPIPFAALADAPEPPAPLVPAPVQVTGRLEPDGGFDAGGGPQALPIVLPGAAAAGLPRRGSPWVLAAVAAAAVIIVIAAVALLVPAHGSRQHVVTAGTPRPSATPDTAPTTAAPAPSTPVTLADAGVNVTVSIIGSPSWVHVVDGSSGSTVFQGILTPGTSKTFHAAQQLKFVFGYSPSVRLLVNGHNIGTPPPNSGNDVANAVFDTTSGG